MDDDIYCFSYTLDFVISHSALLKFLTPAIDALHLYVQDKLV